MTIKNKRNKRNKKGMHTKEELRMQRYLKKKEDNHKKAIILYLMIQYFQQIPPVYDAIIFFIHNKMIGTGKGIILLFCHSKIVPLIKKEIKKTRKSKMKIKYN